MAKKQSKQKSTPLGSFTFVLHSHMPYCRHAGRWPHGEEWIHEAATETYLPLLNALFDLAEEGLPFKLTTDITPILAEQLADPLILEHLDEFLQDKIQRAQSDIMRFQKQGHPHLEYLAKFHYDWLLNIHNTFTERFQRDIIGAFRKLQDSGHLEIASSGATHGYLPLFERDSSIFGQIKVGIESYRRHFGRSPKSFWLPECAYRPAFVSACNGERCLKPGLEEFLAEQGIECFFSETHAIEGGEPVGKARGDAIGPYGDIPKRYLVPRGTYPDPTEKTTFQPYYVQTTDVAVMGRDNRTGLQVWSAEWGYPGDYRYREFHKKDGISGLQYWKVTGSKIDLAFKELYYPDDAKQAVSAHADHFSNLVENLLASYHERTGRHGIIASAYDSELFGHWWFEGVDWIKEVLRRLSRSKTVELTTANGFIEKHPPEDVLALPESSWGLAGNHFTWMNVDTEWVWEPIHQAEIQMEELVAQYPDAEENMRSVLNQAARELLLLQSSDWPFLITTGQAKEYAIERFNEHVDRFNALVRIAQSGRVGERDLWLVEQYEEIDNPFPNIDYRYFVNREKPAPVELGI